MINFPTQIPDCDSQSSGFLDLLILDTSFCSTVAFLPLGNSDHVIVLVSIDFLPNSKSDASLHCLAFDYFCAD